jgi:RNA polymerase sigma-70 factor (ECF subfamily)
LKTDIVDLVKRSQSGDEEAMSEIITLHKKLIFTIAYRLLKDYDASLDVCQETFIKLFQNINRVKDPLKLKSWICSIARNLCYDLLRKEKHLNKDSEITKIGQSEDFTKSVRKKAIIQNALERLNSRDRLLLTLFYYENFDIKEIADIVKIKPENVKVALSRARIRLREELKDYEEELLSTD